AVLPGLVGQARQDRSARARPRAPVARTCPTDPVDPPRATVGAEETPAEERGTGRSERALDRTAQRPGLSRGHHGSGRAVTRRPARVPAQPGRRRRPTPSTVGRRSPALLAQPARVRRPDTEPLRPGHHPGGRARGRAQADQRAREPARAVMSPLGPGIRSPRPVLPAPVRVPARVSVRAPVRSFVPALVTALLLACSACASPGGGSAADTAPPSAPPPPPPPMPSTAPELQNAYEAVVTRVLPSVVQITTDQGLGSGVVFDDRGDIVTNAHVVADSQH